MWGEGLEEDAEESDDAVPKNYHQVRDFGILPGELSVDPIKQNISRGSSCPQVGVGAVHRWFNECKYHVTLSLTTLFASFCRCRQLSVVYLNQQRKHSEAEY